ncbi:hypothetical protein DD237_005228 [Peronospora effusa]|uniref:G-patch domain-containing protein n=1 Tax=Peronospora effusa TaxID=542832 RepID=A0A425CB78_9STRA|nr:hypothetical protein DD237_005228 [Peronospora effusa]
MKLRASLSLPIAPPTKLRRHKSVQENQMSRASSFTKRRNEKQPQRLMQTMEQTLMDNVHVEFVKAVVPGRNKLASPRYIMRISNTALDQTWEMARTFKEFSELKDTIVSLLGYGHFCHSNCPWLYMYATHHFPRRRIFRSRSPSVIAGRLSELQTYFFTLLRMPKQNRNLDCAVAATKLPQLIYDFLFEGMVFDRSDFMRLSERLSFAGRDSSFIDTYPTQDTEECIICCNALVGDATVSIVPAALCSNQELTSMDKKVTGHVTAGLTTLNCGHCFHDECILAKLNESLTSCRCAQPRDAQGRRRFHGAFTGGFSAGYYNSVGSEEGWTPQTFSSSRGNRSSRVEQRPEDFMDEEDDPLMGKRLETSERYDTLQLASKHRLQQQQQSERAQAAAIPGFILPDDWVLPVNDSIGVNLLKQMGWKEGHGIGKRIRKYKFQEEEKDRGGDLMQDADADKTHMQLQEKAEEEIYVPSRKVFDVQKVFPKPKLDRHGAGFDPYTNAPEFSVYKQQQQEKEKEGSYRQGVSFVDALNSSNGSNRVTSGYGLSALEENDDVDVYGTVSIAEYDRVIAPLGAKSNVQRITSSAQSFHRHEKTRRSRALCSDGISVLSGFELAVSKEKPPKVIKMRLAVPSGYTAYHRFDEDEDHDDAVTALYRKFNFLTDATSNGIFVTAKQRSVLLDDNRNDQSDADNVRTGAGDIAKPVESVFDLLGESQKAKLFDAVKQAKQGPPVSRLVPTASVDEPASPKGRQPLICGNNGDQFRATISASIAKRFVSSKSSNEEGRTDSSPNDVPQAKVSRRSQSLWIPKSILCKRFHVKCTGPVGSNGIDDKDDKKRDLFDEELVPHLMEYAADRAAHKQSEADMNKTSKSSEVVEVERAEVRDLPVLPAAQKSCASLLKSIFEPSDESDLSRDSSEDESDDNDDDGKREEALGESKQESPSKLTFGAHVALCSGGDAGESLLVAAEGYRDMSSLSDDEATISTASAASGRVREQVNRHRKRSHSVDTGDDQDAKRKPKEEKRKHKKHKKHHKHRSSSDRKDKKDKKERKSHESRSSRHSRRS